MSGTIKKGASGGPVGLSRAQGLETLEALYQEWLALKADRAASRVRAAEERTRLDQQGSFLVGAVRAAGEGPPVAGPTPRDALVSTAGLDDFLREAEGRLAAARKAIEESIAAEEAAQAQALEDVRERIRERVQRFLEKVRPRLRVLPQPVGAARTILHVERVSPDEAVLLLNVLTGRIPSRYGFLFDDSTEELALPSPSFYPDEGVSPQELRPSGQVFRDRLRGPGVVLPIKGFLPVWVPRPGGGEDLFRLRQRGPVMEAELLEGDDFRFILAREEAERLTGHLLRLKLEGRLELEIGGVS